MAEKATRPSTVQDIGSADSLLTIEQAADRLSMSVRHVRRLVAERRIVFYRLGRSVRLKPTDIAAYIDAGRVDPLTASDVWRDLRSVVA